jgi:hypothetical protein
MKGFKREALERALSDSVRQSLVAIVLLIAPECLCLSAQTKPNETDKSKSSTEGVVAKKAAKVEVADATPEDALKTFMLALISHDEPALRTVSLPTPDFDWLLKGPPAPPEVIRDAKEQFAKLPIKRLKVGEKVTLPRGKEYVVTANEVSRDRAVLLPQGSPVPTRLHDVDGHWKVVTDPFIAARKAVDAARKKAADQKAAPKAEVK